MSKTEEKNHYTPHITLGKILNMNGENKINLNSLNLTKLSQFKIRFYINEISIKIKSLFNINPIFIILIFSYV